MRREGLAKTAVTIGLLVAAGDVPVKGTPPTLPMFRGR